MKDKVKNFLNSTKGKALAVATSTGAITMLTSVTGNTADDTTKVIDPFTNITSGLQQYITYGLAALGGLAVVGLGIFGSKWAVKQAKSFFSSVTK